MIKAKPRWKDWENICVHDAVQEKIRLKVISAALGRTLTSVSKKIKKLGLKKSANGFRNKKKNNSILSAFSKMPVDLVKMNKIIEKHAPLTIFQEGKMVLQGGCWTKASPMLQIKKKQQCIGSLQKKDASFTHGFPLEYNILKEKSVATTNKNRERQNPCYVSLQHVEEWAISDGFQLLEKRLQQHGLSYWKAGSYFSKTQLLIYVNSRRLEKKLHPLVFYEEESGLIG
ncbi:MAG: hypothetical protein KBD36_06305 [Alphaproteobacteria bacterium]|nr:hypothetical protein [Alphaproteobacteria bacterium]MBP9777432.1 hypothetical protein [Alphaproteobacteria bacterium]